MNEAVNHIKVVHIVKPIVVAFRLVYNMMIIVHTLVEAKTGNGGGMDIGKASTNMTLKDWLLQQTWVVWRVDGVNRKVFQDTAFGPMWYALPDEVEVPTDLMLDDVLQVKKYSGDSRKSILFNWDDLPLEPPLN